MGLELILPGRFFDDTASEARPAGTVSTNGNRRPIGFLSQDLRGSIGWACRERSRSPQTRPSRPSRAGWPLLAEPFAHGQLRARDAVPHRSIDRRSMRNKSMYLFGRC